LTFLICFITSFYEKLANIEMKSIKQKEHIPRV